MAMPSNIRTHSLADPTKASMVIQAVLAHLRHPTYFNTALPLYRRLQFGRFLDSSYLFTNLHLEHSHPDQTAGDTPWFYAFVDRGCRPETEVWLFGSWEVEVEVGVEVHPASDAGLENDNLLKADTPRDQAIRTLLLDFLKSIKSMETPPSIHRPEDVLAAQTQLATANNSSNPHLPDPNVLLLGALHSTTVPHLASLSLLSPPLLPPMPNHTFHFPLAALPPPTPLPPNLRWGKLSPNHFLLVRSRTEIARQDYTLARLPNLAIFPIESEEDGADGDAALPIAWAFVGLDGSLTTLHTEAEFRRLGLGMALSAKLFRDGMGRFFEEEEEVVEERMRLAHGNVAVGNEKSAGMCRRLGGREGSVVYWVTVDLGRV